MMQTDFMDETGRQIPVEFEQGNIVSRAVSKLMGFRN